MRTCRVEKSFDPLALSLSSLLHLTWYTFLRYTCIYFNEIQATNINKRSSLTRVTSRLSVFIYESFIFQAFTLSLHEYLPWFRCNLLRVRITIHLSLSLLLPSSLSLLYILHLIFQICVTRTMTEIAHCF